MDYLRQTSILDPGVDIKFPVTVIGVGGIGSPTANTLVHTGFPDITVIDPDTVEPHNIAPQMFRVKDFDMEHPVSKVAARKQILTSFSDAVTVTAHAKKFQEVGELSGVVVGAVDTPETRVEIWNRVEWNEMVPLYVDGRIGREHIQVLTIDPNDIDDIEYYQEHLPPKMEFEQPGCTDRSIAYVGSIIGGIITSQIKKWMKNEPYKKYISWNLQDMYLVLD